MKLLIVNNEFPPIGGGAGRGSYYLARELSRMGVDVSILTSTSSLPSDLPVLADVKIHRVFGWRKSVHEAGKRGMLMFTVFGLARFASLLLTEHYDLIYYCASIPAGLFSVIAPHYPSLLSLHGLDVPGRDKDSFETIHRLLKPINLQTWCWAGMVTATSTNLADSAHEYVPDLPIEVIYNGVDTDIFYPAPSRPPNRPFRIISVSRLIKLKGLQYLIEAMISLDPAEFQLTLVGKGSYEVELRALVQRLNVQDRVTFAGYQDHHVTSQMLRDFDLFVLPSYGDSFGQAFLEAMACGIPIIGAAVGGPIELIRHGENGWLVPAHDVQALVDAICTLADDAPLRDKLREAGLRKVQTDHQWPAHAQRYYALFQSVLARRQQRVQEPFA